MNNQDNPRQHTVLGDDETVSVADALLSPRSKSVAELAESYEASEPHDRRGRKDLTDVVRNSVFGRPEPAAAISVTLKKAALSSGGQVPPVRGRVLKPKPVAVGVAASVGQSPSALASLARSVEQADMRRRRVTTVLASLFVLALAGSVAVTALGLGGTAEADIDATNPTVQGTTQTASTVSVTQPPTTVSPTNVSPSTVAAPPTTEPTTTQAPTTASTTTSTTTSEPTTTAAPTTAAPATTARPATTRRPTTTRPPTTQATTAVTLPDVTFSQPTWAGTDSAP